MTTIMRFEKLDSAKLSTASFLKEKEWSLCFMHSSMAKSKRKCCNIKC